MSCGSSRPTDATPSPPQSSTRTTTATPALSCPACRRASRPGTSASRWKTRAARRPPPTPSSWPEARGIFTAGGPQRLCGLISMKTAPHALCGTTFPVKMTWVGNFGRASVRLPITHSTVPALSALPEDRRSGDRSQVPITIGPSSTRVVLKGSVMSKARLFFVSTFLALAAFLFYGATAQQPAAHVLPKVEEVTVNAPVTLTDNGDSWTLDNGIVKATILKRNGNISSLVYHGVETQTHGEYWEQVPSGTVTARVTIDPATNGGERAEVSVLGVNPGNPNAPSPLGGPPGGGVPAAQDPRFPATAPAAADAGGPGGGRRPGAPRDQGAPGGPRPGGPRGGGMDIETRYAMERGSSGFYTYAEYTHKASYPPAGEGESRFILESMNPTFNWLSVDQDRNQLMTTDADLRKGVVIHAKEQRILLSGVYANSVEHKYSYNAVMYKLTAWGWSSTRDHIGVYFINPSNEYIGGGAEKLDLIAHMGATLLDYWTSGHYAGGSGNNIPAGESWKHVVGPIFVYFNSLDDPKDPSQAELDKLTATAGSGMPAVPAEWHDNAMALWDDAVAKSKSVKAAWPYSWVDGVDYPHKDGRATVSGQLILDDPQAAKKTLPHLTVGLAHPNYTNGSGGFQSRGGNGNIVTWPHDGDYYQFWV